MSADDTRPWPIYNAQTEQRIVELVRNGQVYDYSGRAPVVELEGLFSELHDGLHVISFNSGTSALFALLAALDIGEGDEVLVPNLTFLASASPLLWLGATPILVDSHPHEPSISPAAVSQALTPRTKAVIVTHLFGNPVDLEELARLCMDRNVLLIEDCSHAHASHVAGQHVGTFGDGAIYSIGAGKMVSGGHGGLLVTKHSDVRDIALLIGHFKPRTRTNILNPQLQAYAEFALGGNLRLSPLAATLAIDHLGRLTELAFDRQLNVDFLNDAFSGLLNPIRVESPRCNGTHFDLVYQLPDAVPSSSRNALATELQRAGVMASAPSTRPLNRVLRRIAAASSWRTNMYVERLNRFAKAAPSDGDLPNSTVQHDRMLSFPSQFLYRADLDFATEMVARAEPVLKRFLDGVR